MSNKQMFTTSKNDKECGELKNIQYQTMLLNGAPENVCGKEDNVDTFQDFIDNQKEADIYKPWSKLEKMIKIERLEAYVDTLNQSLKPMSEGDEPLSDTQKQELKTYLKTALNRKKLQRVKEVQYDKQNGCILDIPGLFFNKKRNFTLRRERKAESSLKTLAPKTKTNTGKTSKTVKAVKAGKAGKAVKAEKQKKVKKVKVEEDQKDQTT